MVANILFGQIKFGCSFFEQINLIIVPQDWLFTDLQIIQFEQMFWFVTIITIMWADLYSGERLVRLKWTIFAFFNSSNNNDL